MQRETQQIRGPRGWWRVASTAGLMAVSAPAVSAHAGVVSPLDSTARDLRPAVRRDSIARGERIIRAMHDRYTGKWFKTMTFTQTTTQLTAEGLERTSTWYGTVSLPGLLRIDIGDPHEGNGVLYTPDSVFRMRDGQVALRAGKANELLPLTFDVYVVPVERTIASLHTIGFNLAVVHREMLDGRMVYVVGADSGDVQTPQFWIDKERLVLVRQIEHPNNDSTRVLDVQFDQFQQKGASWIAARVRIAINGKLVQTETHDDMKLDVPVNLDLFDVTKWTTAAHWVQAKKRESS